ncbi:hypothetical protein OAE25_02815, partial [Verrucomicrobiales bacterium]|nr:hypothetical protein [Verrucomicrobiales bacterium]
MIYKRIEFDRKTINFAFHPNKPAFALRFHSKPSQRPIAASKAVSLDAHLLKHPDEDITQRGVVVLVKRQVLPVAKPTTREDNWEVVVIVNVGITHVAAIENHGVVQQAAVRLLDFLEIPKKVAEQLHLRGFDLFQLFQLRL